MDEINDDDDEDIASYRLTSRHDKLFSGFPPTIIWINYQNTAPTHDDLNSYPQNLKRQEKKKLSQAIISKY